MHEKRDFCCDVKAFPKNTDCEGRPIASQEQLGKKLYTIDGDPITEDRRKQMEDYARQLRSKFPHMKPDRIARKTAEYFKVKLK